MLRAVADKRIKELGVKLIIAGEFYDDRKEYDDLILKLGISDQIIMKSDFIPAEDVSNYFCVSDFDNPRSSEPILVKSSSNSDSEDDISLINDLDSQIAFEDIWYDASCRQQSLVH